MNEIFRDLAALVHEQGEAIGKDCFHFTDFMSLLYTLERFFYLDFLSRTFTIQRIARKWVG